MNLFIKGYEKANGIEHIAKIIVSLLKLINTIKANKHKKTEYINASFIEIFPAAIGLFFVLSTFLSNFLSEMSFTMQPADLINIEPRRKNIR